MAVFDGANLQEMALPGQIFDVREDSFLAIMNKGRMMKKTPQDSTNEPRIV